MLIIYTEWMTLSASKCTNPASYCGMKTLRSVKQIKLGGINLQRLFSTIQFALWTLWSQQPPYQIEVYA